MNKHAIYHVLDVPYAYGKDIDTLVLRIRVATDDIEECSVLYRCRYDWESEYKRKPMRIVAQTEIFTYYEVELSIYRNRYRYYFELKDKENNICIYTERGVLGVDYSNIDVAAFQFPYISDDDLYKEEKWLQESIVYQIFPDRFFNGNPDINPDYIKDWGKGKVGRHSMYGGDIRGIIQKLDYLKELGIDLIYLTPIFKSSTNHKYNTADYFEIDPTFGTLEDAKELVLTCHEKGIRIVFDAVFNHSGSDFFAFKDLLANQENSKYVDWYFIDSLPVDIKKCNYYTFANGCSNMPKLNTSNKEVREYLLSVAKYWVKEINIDGWRLDVCDEVSHEFWREFRKEVKSVKSDAIIVGEIMHEANSFLKGDQLDSIMNYPFKNATIDFFGKHNISALEYLDILSANRMLYMNSITKQMWNLVGSHDTKRIINECNNNIGRMKLAITMQFTYVGVPYIYYGDEVGITGEDDPDNRKCMIWDEKKQNKELLNFYKTLISIRKNNKSLIYGDFDIVYCKDEVIGFTREYGDDRVLVILNNSEEERYIKFDIKGYGRELVTNKKVNFKDEIKVGQIGVMIIKF